jgi:hypothetical protein
MPIESTIARYFGRVRVELHKETMRAALAAAEYTASNVRREIFDWTSRTSTRKSGALARSFQPEVKGNGRDQLSAGVFSSNVYANIHEHGGRIFPKKGKYLAIPITKKASRFMPRNFPEPLVFLHWPPRAPVLATVKIKGAGFGKITAQYILRTHVRITKKGYLQKAEKASADGVEKIFGAAFRRAIEHVNAG